jgi:hypothetical protein
VDGLPPDSALRASNRERERAVSRLRRSFLDGRLSEETFERRVAAAYGAAMRRDVDSTCRDLPGSRLRELLGALGRYRFWRSQARDLPVLTPPATERKGAVLVGRSHGCAIVYDEPSVSRAHAALRRRDGGWSVVDLGSTNGTYVNGLRVTEAPVEDGDRLDLGRVRVRFVAPS